MGLTAALAPSQTITTVAGNTSWGRVTQVAFDASGNMYAADYDKQVVYKIDRLGATITFAGTGAADTPETAHWQLPRLYNPLGVAVGTDGSVYIAEYTSNRIRKVAPNGIITTFAGTGVAGFLGDGRPASAARLNGPIQPVFDAAGNLFFVDNGNFWIRKITPAGTITTVAGSGSIAFTGDGRLATSTNKFPGWIQVMPDGTIYFTDDRDTRSNGSKWLRKIAPERHRLDCRRHGRCRVHRRRRPCYMGSATLRQWSGSRSARQYLCFRNRGTSYPQDWRQRDH